jgi:hypothetical protein
MYDVIDNTPLALLGGVTRWFLMHICLYACFSVSVSPRSGKWFLTLCRDIWPQKHINENIRLYRANDLTSEQRRQASLVHR